MKNVRGVSVFKGKKQCEPLEGFRSFYARFPDHRGKVYLSISKRQACAACLASRATREATTRPFELRQGLTGRVSSDGVFTKTRPGLVACERRSVRRHP